MTGTALILGGNGRFGRHMAEAFWNAGWRVRTFDRARDNLMEVASGADVIVNGWNPAYPDWSAQLPGLTDQVIRAAEAHGATILQPANIYVYGTGSPEVLRTETPHRAINSLGRLRIEMEAKLAASSAQVILLRAGDYIDTEASGNWFDSVITKSITKGRMVSPGDRDVPHAWAWLPDLARAAVKLCERREALERGGEDIGKDQIIRRVLDHRAARRPAGLDRPGKRVLRGRDVRFCKQSENRRKIRQTLFRAVEDLGALDHPKRDRIGFQ